MPLGSNGFCAYYNHQAHKTFVGEVRRIQGSMFMNGYSRKVTDNKGEFLNTPEDPYSHWKDEHSVVKPDSHDMVEVIAMDKIRYWVFVRTYNSKDPTECARYMWSEGAHFDWATKFNGAGQNNIKSEQRWYDPKTYKSVKLPEYITFHFKIK